MGLLIYNIIYLGMITSIGAKGIVEIFNDNVVLNCHDNTIEDSVRHHNHVLSVPTQVITTSTVTILECESTEPYAMSLKALNLNVTAINTLKINITRRFRSELLIGLPVQTLVVTNEVHYVHKQSSISSTTSSISSSLSYVQRVFIFLFKKYSPQSKVVEPLQFPSLPMSTQLMDVTLIEGFSIGDWGGCTVLQRLKLKNWMIPLTKNGWLAHCPNLTELHLTVMTTDAVHHALRGVITLTSLTVSKCKLTNGLSTILAEAGNLLYLDLSGNSFSSIPSNSFAKQTQLESLNLANNHLWSTYDLSVVTKNLWHLRTLILDGNSHLDLCYWRPEHKEEFFEFINQPPFELEHLSLRDTGLWHACFSTWHSLTTLDLSWTNISHFELNTLPVSSTHSLLVDLRGTRIKYPPSYNQSQYMPLIYDFKEIYNMTILVNMTLGCDCRHMVLAKVLGEVPRLTLRGVICTTGELLSQVPLERLACKRYNCNRCICRRRFDANSTVTADCNKRFLSYIPSEIFDQPNLHTLDMRDNSLTKMHPEEYPGTVQMLDIRDNKISRIEAHSMLTLLSIPNRSVRLAGNSLVCDCLSKPMLTILQEHQKQVDYENITCIDGRLLSKKLIDNLCNLPLQLWAILAIVASISTVISVCVTLGYRFKRSIKEFLYTRGCCLSCLYDDEVETDREYDAFISFCHEDDAFVTTNLLPNLESYRLCIHYRDWNVGDWIPAQITRSIERSCRTIVVLSKNFLNSSWGLMEFRMAHAAMLQDGRKRLIAVIIDNVMNEDLDVELRGYLTSNTYVKWGDPWFFKKLAYALPHKRVGVDNLEGGIDIVRLQTASDGYLKESLISTAV